MQPDTHFSALYRTKYEGNWEEIVLWRTEPQFQAVEFRCVTAVIVGLDCSKQSSLAAVATLYRVGRACYPWFGMSGSWMTSSSLDTRESLVLPEELGCTSCCFGTESEKTISVKHKSRSWREVWRHLLSEKGTVVSCGPFAIPYHARSPQMKSCFSLYLEICFELARGGLSRILHFFPDVLCSGWKAKDRP